MILINFYLKSRPPSKRNHTRPSWQSVYFHFPNAKCPDPPICKRYKDWKMPDLNLSPSTSPVTLTFDEPTSLHLLLLRIGGLLNSNSNLTTFLLGLLAHLSESLITVSCVWSILSAEGSQRYDIERIAETVGHCGGHSRFLILYLSRERLAGCVRASRDLWDDLDGRGRETVAQYVARSVRLVRFYGGACGFMCVAYVTATQITPVLEAAEENVTVYRWVLW